MDRNHKLCDGTGWVCEEHPSKPFGHVGCLGPGIPCACNPEEAVDWKEIYSTVKDTGPEIPG